MAESFFTGLLQRIFQKKAADPLQTRLKFQRFRSTYFGRPQVFLGAFPGLETLFQEDTISAEPPNWPLFTHPTISRSPFLANGLCSPLCPPTLFAYRQRRALITMLEAFVSVCFDPFFAQSFVFVTVLLSSPPCRFAPSSASVLPIFCHNSCSVPAMFFPRPSSAWLSLQISSPGFCAQRRVQ